MKNNNSLISIVLGVATIFFGVALVAWTLIPRAQIRTAYTAFHKAKSGDTEMVLNTGRIFTPYTYAQPQIRNEFLEFTFDLYKNKSAAVMDLLPFANQKMQEVVDRDATHPKYLLTMAKGYNLHADLINSKEMYDLSSTYYQKALALVPQNPDIIYAWGVSLVDQGKSKEGIVLLEDLLKANPDIAESHYYLGLAYYKIGNYNQALALFEKALASNPLLNTTTTVDVYVKLFEHYYLKRDIGNFVIVSTRLSTLDTEQGSIHTSILAYIAKHNKLPPINIEKQ